MSAVLLTGTSKTRRRKASSKSSALVWLSVKRSIQSMQRAYSSMRFLPVHEVKAECDPIFVPRRFIAKAIAHESTQRGGASSARRRRRKEK